MPPQVAAMFWRLAILAVGAGLLFGAPWQPGSDRNRADRSMETQVDLASIGAAVESMSEALECLRVTKAFAA